MISDPPGFICLDYDDQRGVFKEHCGVKNPLPKIDYWDIWGDTVLVHLRWIDEQYTRTAQSQMKLFTGGKRKPLRHLWALGAVAREVLDKRARGPREPYEEIDAERIIVNGERLNSSHLVYQILPEGETIDVTPTVPGVDFYDFDVDGNKYKSHFTVRLRIPDPNNPCMDVLWEGFPPVPDPGHAMWSLSTEAPQEGIDRFMGVNLSELLTEMPVGYYPTGNALGSPGKLEHPDSGSSTCNSSYPQPFEIGFSDLIWGLKKTEQIKDSPGTYALFSHNCMHAVREAAAAAGVALPPVIYPAQLANYYNGLWCVCYPSECP